MYEIRISLVSEDTYNHHYFFIVREIDNEIVYYRVVVDNNIKKRLTKSYINKLLRLEYFKLVFSIYSRNKLLSKKSIIEYVI